MLRRKGSRCSDSDVKGMKDQLTLMTDKVNQLEKASNAASKKQYYKDLQLTSKNQQANNQNGKNKAENTENTASQAPPPTRAPPLLARHSRLRETEAGRRSPAD